MSQNTLITGGLFKQLNQVVILNSELNESFGLHLLSQAIALGATHDSSERYPPRRCGLNTHAKVRAEILNWAHNPDRLGNNIMWISGPQDAGKTAIAQTIAESLADSRALAGSFFFVRGKSRQDDANHLFLTLAYQLAMNIPGIRGFINSAMLRDPTLVSKSIWVQMQSLIVEPFQELLSSGPHPIPISTVIIDGLDECNTTSAQRDIIMLVLGFLAPTLSRIPLRFLIFSRPQENIMELFKAYALFKLVQHIHLDRAFDHSNFTALFGVDEPAVIPDEEVRSVGTSVVTRISPVANIVALRAIHGPSSPLYANPSPTTTMDVSCDVSPRSTMDISPKTFNSSPPDLSSPMNFSPFDSPASMMMVDLSSPAIGLTSMKAVDEYASPRSLGLELFPFPGSPRSAEMNLPSTGEATFSSPSSRVVDLFSHFLYPTTTTADMSPRLGVTSFVSLVNISAELGKSMANGISAVKAREGPNPKNEIVIPRIDDMV